MPCRLSSTHDCGNGNTEFDTDMVIRFKASSEPGTTYASSDDNSLPRQFRFKSIYAILCRHNGSFEWSMFIPKHLNWKFMACGLTVSENRAQGMFLSMVGWMDVGRF